MSHEGFISYLQSIQEIGYGEYWGTHSSAVPTRSTRKKLKRWWVRIIVMMWCNK